MTGKNRTARRTMALTSCRVHAGEALAISIPRSEGGGDPALSGAHALRAVRAGCSVMNAHRPGCMAGRPPARAFLLTLCGDARIATLAGQT